MSHDDFDPDWNDAPRPVAAWKRLVALLVVIALIVMMVAIAIQVVDPGVPL